MIREATPADIPFLLDLAKERYDRPFDVEAAKAFLRASMLEPSSVVLRSDNGAAVVSITRAFWNEKPRAYLVFIVSRPTRGMIGDGMRLARAADAWRRGRGAVAMHFGEDTGINMGVLAKRLGARVDRPSYVLDTGPVAEEAAPARLSGSTLLDRMLSSPGLLSGRPNLSVVKA